VNREKEIFKNGSTTYYWSSRFFPEDTRNDVFKLYSFVRIADDLVDSIPQDKKRFKHLENAWQKTVKTGKLPSSRTNPDISLAVNNMYEVYTKYAFEKIWVSDFLGAMAADLNVKEYKTLKQTIKYMHGSAEVIGLMMSKIIGVSEAGYEAAMMQGRAMQYINFIRDINEDIALGRRYLPKDQLNKYGLKELTKEYAYKHPGAYREFIEGQLALYREWQSQANAGFKYVPRTQRIALRTAVDMYNWTASTIAKNPYVVFDNKVKPSKIRVVGRAIVRSVHA
jgi:15-cis-phytoene synthase